MIRDIQHASDKALRGFGQQVLHYVQLGMFHEEHCSVKAHVVANGHHESHDGTARPGPMSSDGTIGHGESQKKRTA